MILVPLTTAQHALVKRLLSSALDEARDVHDHKREAVFKYLVDLLQYDSPTITPEHCDRVATLLSHSVHGPHRPVYVEGLTEEDKAVDRLSLKFEALAQVGRR